MPLTLTWSEIAVRLLCTLLAGSLLGMNRSEHGHAAGLRTSILVSLSACVAMIQVNLLLTLAGRHPDSFVMNDLMRLPLGILSGMGFIGAGAIVRRDNLIVGVTTAATMWFLTVLGLCFGGGQVALGLVGTVLGVIVLAVLRVAENKMKQDRQGKLIILSAAGGPDDGEIRDLVQNEGFVVASSAFATVEGTDNREWSCELRWHAKAADTSIPSFVRLLTGRTGVVRIAWTPQSR